MNDKPKETSTEILKRILPQLQEMGLTEVIVTYDGGGDEGSVQDVVGYKGKKEVRIDMPLYDELDEACVLSLQEKGIDWCNGNGGCGKYEINVKTRKAKLSHQERVEEYHDEDFDEEEIN